MQKEIDDLKIELVDVDLITEEGHGCCGQELVSPYDIYLQKEIQMFGLELPIVLYWENFMLKIADGWHRWKSFRNLGIKTIPAVVFNSKKDCHPTKNLQW